MAKMKLEYRIDEMANLMALMVLRQIRDWNRKESLAAFTGDPEKQYKVFFDVFRDIIVKSGLFDPAAPTEIQREEWLRLLDLVERKTYPLERHLAAKEGKYGGN